MNDKCALDGVWLQAAALLRTHHYQACQCRLRCTKGMVGSVLNRRPVLLGVPAPVQGLIMAARMSLWSMRQVLDLLEHKAIFTAGYKAVLHVHSLVEECEITKLLAQIDPKTRERKKARRSLCAHMSRNMHRLVGGAC